MVEWAKNQHREDKEISTTGMPHATTKSALWGRLASFSYGKVNKISAVGTGHKNQHHGDGSGKPAL